VLQDTAILLFIRRIVHCIDNVVLYKKDEFKCVHLCFVL
jgi:hypothetical protein